MVEPVSVAKFGDVGIDEPYLRALNLGIALGNRAFTKTQRLNLGSCQSYPSFKLILDIKIITGNETITCGSIKVKTFPISHTIPDSMGLIVTTPLGDIVFIEDVLTLGITVDVRKVTSFPYTVPKLLVA